MENQDWFRDIENTMSDYLNEYMNNNAPASSSRNHQPGFGNANNNRYHNQSRTHDDVSEHRLYLLINECMQDYYGSMRLYQENMRDVIHLLREFRRTPATPYPNHSFPFPDINTPQRPTTQPTQQIPNPPPTTDNINNFPLSTTSFAYFIQPFVRENEEPVGLTNQQIEHAIERIVYDASMSNSYNAVTTDSDDIVADRCPICLEDFQIGEQVLRIRGCGHIFKQPGLLRWFQRNNHCPVCRGNVNDNQPSPEGTQSQNVQEPAIQTTSHQNRLTQNRAINNLIENHIRNPLMREFGNLIQNIAQGNRDGRTQYSFFDFSLNDQL
jgi:hypothetical protein